MDSIDWTYLVSVIIEYFLKAFFFLILFMIAEESVTYYKKEDKATFREKITFYLVVFTVSALVGWYFSYDKVYIDNSIPEDSFWQNVRDNNTHGVLVFLYFFTALMLGTWWGLDSKKKNK